MAKDRNVMAPPSTAQVKQSDWSRYLDAAERYDAKQAIEAQEESKRRERLEQEARFQEALGQARPTHAELVNLPGDKKLELVRRICANIRDFVYPLDGRHLAEGWELRSEIEQWCDKYLNNNRLEDYIYAFDYDDSAAGSETARS